MLKILHLNAEWEHQAIARIQSCLSVREAISCTAGYLSDLHDELISLQGDHALAAEYLCFIDQEIKQIESLGDQLEEGNMVLWMGIRKVMEIYFTMPRLGYWELGQIVVEQLEDLLDPETNRQDAIFKMLAGFISYQHGWVVGARQAWARHSNQFK